MTLRIRAVEESMEDPMLPHCLRNSRHDVERLTAWRVNGRSSKRSPKCCITIVSVIATIALMSVGFLGGMIIKDNLKPISPEGSATSAPFTGIYYMLSIILNSSPFVKNSKCVSIHNHTKFYHFRCA